MLPAVVTSGRNKPTDQELLAVVEANRERALAWLTGFQNSLTSVQDPQRLSDLHAYVATYEQAVVRMIKERKAKLVAAQMLAEVRLRIERQLGIWLLTHVNHSGGGDRRSVSSAGTAVRDLPEGISRNDSSRFQKIGHIPEVDFDRWLVNCRDKGQEITTKAALKLSSTYVRGHHSTFQPTEGVAQNLEDLVARNVRYGCLYIDPPWEYGNTKSNGAATNHYPALTVEQLAALPVKNLAADQSHCHLWTTTVHMPSAIELLGVWGFEYKSIFVWLKEGLGLGNYWRVGTEFLLLGVRGAAPFTDHGQPNWLAGGRAVHSEKPETIRRLIEQVSPGPYLELFARRQVPGWTTWGNEVPPPAQSTETESPRMRRHRMQLPRMHITSNEATSFIPTTGVRRGVASPQPVCCSKKGQ